MSLKLIHAPKQAAHVVRWGLGLDSLCPPSKCMFEIVRATVWSLAAPSGRVHTNRVLGAALPAWRLASEREKTSDEKLRAELREALTTLEDTGDLIGLSGGYWAPATTRFAELPDGVGYLLVGGAPSALLQFGNEAIRFHGPHRHLAKIPPKLADAIPLEDFKSWAKLPEISLQEWACEVFESLERSTYTPTSADVFEFYLPAKSRTGTPQFFRWYENAGDITGTLLARRRRLYGVREFRLVDVRSGQIGTTCELHNIDVRRLMYALDFAANNPVRAQPLRAGTRTEWLFKSELPRAEQRTFAAFGTLTIPDDRPFERRWTFVRNIEIALDMLRSLGIALGPQPGEDCR